MPAEKTKVKSTKPLMEKRRRARINDSLMQLKTLVLDALNKNNPRHSKLEKADILEMTVRYLRTIQRQQIAASVNTDPAKLGKYRSGYAECVNEVTRYLGATTTTDGAPELRTQLVGHLANLCTSNQQTSPTRTSSISPQQLHQQSQATFQYASSDRHHQQLAEPSMSYAEAPRHIVAANAMSPSVDSTATVPVHYNAISPIPEGARAEFALTAPVYNTHDSSRVGTSPSPMHAPQSPNNSTRVVMSPPVDVTGSLPSGEITLVLPQQALQNGQLPTHFIPVYAQGPVVVSPTTTNTNVQTVSPTNSRVVSMPSPQSASMFRSIATDGSYRSISPSSTATAIAPIGVTCSSPVRFTSSPVLTTSHVQHHTELSPVTREHFAYPKPEMATSAVSHFVLKKESMWRPW